MTPRVPIEDRKLITRLFSEGLKQKAICQRTGRSKTSVSRIIRAFRDEGRITDAKRTGRPRATQHTDDELIVAAVVVDPLLNAKEIRHELSLDISSATIRRRLEEAGISNCAPGKKPFRTEQQRKQRLKSAKESQLWSAEERRVHFSDESTSCSWGDEQRMVRMPSCSRCHCRQYSQFVQLCTHCGSTEPRQDVCPHSENTNLLAYVAANPLHLHPCYPNCNLGTENFPMAARTTQTPTPQCFPQESRVPNLAGPSPEPGFLTPCPQHGEPLVQHNPAFQHLHTLSPQYISFIDSLMRENEALKKQVQALTKKFSPFAFNPLCQYRCDTWHTHS